MQAIIFDFGNVMVHFDPTHITACLAEPGLSPEEKAQLERAAFDRFYWDQLDLGTLSEEDCIPRICEKLPPRLHASVANILREWYSCLPEMEGMSALVRELQANGHPVYLLSNISNTFAAHWQEIPCLQTFDGVVFSASLRKVKPSAEIFQYVLEKFHHTPKECIFVDDAPRNIAGAEACGITGYLFDGDAKKLRDDLLTRGLL